MSNNTVHCTCGHTATVNSDVDRFTCPACAAKLKRGRIGWGHDFTDAQEAIAAIPSRPLGATGPLLGRSRTAIESHSPGDPIGPVLSEAEFLVRDICKRQKP